MPPKRPVDGDELNRLVAERWGLEWPPPTPAWLSLLVGIAVVALTFLSLALLL